MKSRLARLRKAFITIKIYFSRTASYVSMINTAMILFLLLSNLEKYGIDIEIKNWIIPIFLFWIAFMIVFGFIEDKLGFYQEEKRTAEDRSPYLKDIIRRLDKIEKKLK